MDTESGAVPRQRITTNGTTLLVDGAPTRLVGCSNYGLFYHPELIGKAPNPRWQRWLDHLRAHGVNLLREGVFPLPAIFGKAEQPVKCNNPAARPESRTYDINVNNDAFWQFFHAVVDFCGKRGILVEVTVWDHYSLYHPEIFYENPLYGGGVKDRAKKSDFFVRKPAANGGGYETIIQQFYRDPNLQKKVEARSRQVLRELAKHWNILIEPLNEPAAWSIDKVNKDDVNRWHREFYKWAQEEAPHLPLVPNLVPLDGDDETQATRFAPEASHHLVSMVSFHAGPNTWLPTEQEIRDDVDVAARVAAKSAALVNGIGKPCLMDTDAAHTGNSPNGRQNNRRLWLYTLGVLRGGGHFNHRDGAPYGLWELNSPLLDELRAKAQRDGNQALYAALGDAVKGPPLVKNMDPSEHVDEQAISALFRARQEHEGTLPPQLDIWSFHPQPVELNFDYAADTRGRGYLVSWHADTLQTRISTFEGGKWSKPEILPGASGKTGRSELYPRVACAGETVFVVFGFNFGVGLGLGMLSRTGAGPWVSHPFARRPPSNPDGTGRGAVIETFGVCVCQGELCVATGELEQEYGWIDGAIKPVPHTDIYNNRLYRFNGSAWRELTLGTGGGGFPVLSSRGSTLTVLNRHTRQYLHRVVGNAVTRVTLSDFDGDSPGDAATALDAQGRLHVVNIPFDRIQRDLWCHLSDQYPTRVAYRVLDSKGQVVAGTKHTLDELTDAAEGYTRFVYTTFQPTLGFDQVDAAISVYDKDGMIMARRVLKDGSLGPNREIAPGFTPKMVTRKVGNQTYLDVVFSGGRSGLMAVKLPTPAKNSGVLRAKTPENTAGILSVWRPKTGVWWLRNVQDGGTLTVQWGEAGDVPLVGNLCGDSGDDLVIWRPKTGVWWLHNGETGERSSFQWGQSGDVPLLADLLGEGRKQAVVFRPKEGRWYLRSTLSGETRSVVWGREGDIPVPGDYDGDGVDELAVWRPSDGTWRIRQLDGSARVVQWGLIGDVPRVTDFTGDGRADMVTWRPSNGNWYIKNAQDESNRVVQWGQAGDVPLPGDYLGEGKAQFVVWRPGTGVWWIKTNDATQSRQVQWGEATDLPV